MGKLFLLFTVLPLVDLWLLLRIGRVLGGVPTLALVVVTGFAGAWLARAEGERVVRGWRRALAEGRVPEEGLLNGALVLAGGVLLVAPGVLTDALGLALLFPPTRRVAAAGVRRWARRKVAQGQVRVVTMRGPGVPGPDDAIDVTPRRPDDVIDVTPRRPGGPGGA
jgi:UPF0716 protein FxsA